MDAERYNESLDEYARALLAQNNGMPCTHCGSSLGHRSWCALLNRDAAELASTQPIAERTIAVPEFSEQDRIQAHAMGVKR